VLHDELGLEPGPGSASWNRPFCGTIAEIKADPVLDHLQ
jgi:hypothetical protein